jgi:hypothetical protein
LNGTHIWISNPDVYALILNQHYLLPKLAAMMNGSSKRSHRLITFLKMPWSVGNKLARAALSFGMPKGISSTRSVSALPAVPDIQTEFHKYVVSCLATGNPTKESFRKHNYSSAAVPIDGLKHLPDIKRVVVVGSGGLSIGQAGEFDYSGKHF